MAAITHVISLMAWVAPAVSLSRPPRGLREFIFRPQRHIEAITMAKGQLRGSRETKKPKKIKPPVAAPSLAKGMLAPISLPKRKG